MFGKIPGGDRTTQYRLVLIKDGTVAYVHELWLFPGNLEPGLILYFLTPQTSIKVGFDQFLKSL
jgi:hypothetical protein